MDRRKSLRKKVAAEGANDIDRFQLTDLRKRLPRNEEVEGVNGSRYIHPQKFRDKNVQFFNRSSLLLLAKVRDWLSVEEKAIFMGTAIGHLLSVPDDSKFSSTIVHFLLSREIYMDGKPDEMHFEVGGKVLHFGKTEFALITGLSFKKSEKAFASPRNPSSLMKTHFPNQRRVSALKVKALLFRKKSTCPSLDRVKLALLLVVHNFLMSRQDRDTIEIGHWHLVDDLEEFNKYPWGEVTFDRITKFRLPLLHQANRENSGAGGEPCYTVVGLAHALLVWALDIMPGLLNLCGRKIESRDWQPHMLCVLCTKSPRYPTLIRKLERKDVHVLSDIMWQEGDGNQLIVFGLEEGTPEAPVFSSKKRKKSIEESRPCSYEPEHIPSSANTKGIESLEVGEEPVDATLGFTRASAQQRVEGFELVNNLKIPEEHVILYKKIYEKHGHMATKKVIKFNDDMLLTCVTSLLKIISAMEIVRCSELNEALLERWEGFIKDAEALEFNIKWLHEGLNRLKNHWRSSLGIDREVESHAQVLDAMQVKYVCLSTREDKLNAELSEVQIQKRKAEATISSEQKAIEGKLTQRIKFKNESVLGLVLS